MADELEMEAHEIRDTLDELREEEHKAGDFRGFVQLVALTTALMAVIGAVGAQQAATLSNEALLLSNQSVLAQAKASDTWNEYQADGIKRRVFETQALVTAGNQEQAQQLGDEAKREGDKQPDLMKEAQNLEAERDRLMAESHTDNSVHETFARSVGAVQIGIAMASIAALTRRRELFYLGGGFGLIGAGLLGWGFSGGTF